jgi:hypothetical protein
VGKVQLREKIFPTGKVGKFWNMRKVQLCDPALKAIKLGQVRDLGERQHRELACVT